MTKKDRIIFMGTPEFAAHILREMLERGYNVVAVVTPEDKQAGRGQKIHESAVKKLAVEKGLPVMQPAKLRDEGFVEELRSYEADVQVVVAFRMLPKVVWSMPKKGTFNLHASLLPSYRGAAPINWAIINGEKYSGVTTFFIDEKIDTGEIILQKEIELASDETASSLHNKLMVIGADEVCKTLDLVEKGDVKTTPQPEYEEKPAPKIHKDTCRINWNESVDVVYNFIRGMCDYPTAWGMLRHGGEEMGVKIYSVEAMHERHEWECGKILVEGKVIKVAVREGFIKINRLQLPSKKQVSAKDLLNGFAFGEDDMFV